MKDTDSMSTYYLFSIVTIIRLRLRMTGYLACVKRNHEETNFVPSYSYGMLPGLHSGPTESLIKKPNRSLQKARF